LVSIPALAGRLVEVVARRQIGLESVGQDRILSTLARTFTLSGSVRQYSISPGASAQLHHVSAVSAPGDDGADPFV